MSSEPAPPVADRRRDGRPIRWGIGDFVWIWIVSILVAAVVGAVAYAARGVGTDHEADGVDLAVGIFSQNLAMLGLIALVARRKGMGSLRRDFGLVVRPADWPWVLAGTGVAIASSVVLWPIMELSGNSSPQEAVKALDRSTGPEALVAALGVVLLVPLVEELMFRGLLQRSLLRRLPPVAAVGVSAGVFAAMHVLLDPGSWQVLVPLLALGLLSGIRAARTGELSQSILLHAGFNALAAIQLLH